MPYVRKTPQTTAFLLVHERVSDDTDTGREVETIIGLFPSRLAARNERTRLRTHRALRLAQLTQYLLDAGYEPGRAEWAAKARVGELRIREVPYNQRYEGDDLFPDRRGPVAAPEPVDEWAVGYCESCGDPVEYQSASKTSVVCMTCGWHGQFLDKTVKMNRFSEGSDL
jgi:hypothetical protein